LKTLPLIAAYDQLAAALDELRSRIALLFEVSTLSSEDRARIVHAYRTIEAVIKSVDEVLAFERS
jgi:hypothetical protein